MSEKKMKALRKEAKNPKYYDKPLTTERSVYKALKRQYQRKEKQCNITISKDILNQITPL